MYTNEMMEQLMRCSRDITYFKTFLTNYRESHAEVLWKLMFMQYVNVMFVTRTQVESYYVIEDMTRLYEQLPEWLRCNVTSFNKRSQRFDNGSQILTNIAGPNACRGYTLSFLVLHDFNTWSPDLQAQVLQQGLPAISHGGRLIKD